MDRSYLKRFGEHLRALRENKQLTQWNVACKGDFDRNYVGMVERGERNPSLLNLIRLSQALEVSLTELMNF